MSLDRHGSTAHEDIWRDNLSDSAINIRLLIGLNCGRTLEAVRCRILQNSIVLPTTAPFLDHKRAIHQKVKPMVDAAVLQEGTSITELILIWEAWMTPFPFCTGEKRWCEFAGAVDGESTRFTVNPILERDINNEGTIWNTAIIIGNHGNIIGKHRKLAFGLNGAEIVFDPSVTIGELSKPVWLIAVFTNPYSCLIYRTFTRVGIEAFPCPFASGHGKPQHTDFEDEMLVSDTDLNLCRQLKDKWGFRMIAQYELWIQPRLLSQLAKDLPLFSF
ncbi:hypothetical protein ACJRO7_026942 [Eucalyptus globulus]|uniref:CN hydrolase domain-containing protein n=1 Tax=Eucalyptus globulus TaxID=34317 RepID=A0ABD3JSA3_EUCGL